MVSEIDNAIVDHILFINSAAGGDLHKHCLEQMDSVRTEKEICSLIYQIVEAARYLHDNNVVHLDLKVWFCQLLIFVRFPLSVPNRHFSSVSTKQTFCIDKYVTARKSTIEIQDVYIYMTAWEISKRILQTSGRNFCSILFSLHSMMWVRS